MPMSGVPLWTGQETHWECAQTCLRRGHSYLSTWKRKRWFGVVTTDSLGVDQSWLTDIAESAAEQWAVDNVHLDFRKFCTWDGIMLCTGWGLTTWDAVLLKDCWRIWGPCWTQGWMWVDFALQVLVVNRITKLQWFLPWIWHLLSQV